MIKYLYSVRDIKAQTFCTPFVSLNDMTAKRDFAHACMDQTSQLFKSPEDFSLALVGSFEDDSGEVEAIRPTFLCNAIDYQPKE